jgi:hypothetical protein
MADIAANVQHARIERRTKSRLNAYRHSPDLRYSRLYAYRMSSKGHIEVVPSEAAIVKLVFSLFAEGLTAKEIKRKLDGSDLRNRAGYRWTTVEIAGLLRPVFAGLVRQRHGGFKRSAVYEPIVSRELFDQVVRMRVESTEIGVSGSAPGGRSWIEPRLVVKECGIQLSEAFLRTADRVAILAGDGCRA